MTNCITRRSDRTTSPNPKVLPLNLCFMLESLIFKIPPLSLCFSPKTFIFKILGQKIHFPLKSLISKFLFFSKTPQLANQIMKEVSHYVITQFKPHQLMNHIIHYRVMRSWRWLGFPHQNVNATQITLRLLVYLDINPHKSHVFQKVFQTKAIFVFPLKLKP